MKPCLSLLHNRRLHSTLNSVNCSMTVDNQPISSQLFCMVNVAGDTPPDLHEQGFLCNCSIDVFPVNCFFDWVDRMSLW